MTVAVDHAFEALARVGQPPPRYVADAYRYRRRPTRVVYVGSVGVGGQNPIRVQSMTTTDTMDTAATVAEVIRLVAAGCEIVRITAPTVQDARNLGAIRRALAGKGIRVPLVADIHFSPAAALEAAEHVEKVRINPGNFADSKRFAVREYTDDQYGAELARLEERFAPLVEKCQARGIAMRIGTNHGSLSDRIMNRFGDTPLGMVESALEFAQICRRHGYHDLIFSMKASNPKVMIQAYRLLAARLDELGYPFHLGVTEAGNGEDGRIKSAIGIGSLLEDGIGDTIRVSLTEDPEREVPVAFALAAPYQPSPPGDKSARLRVQSTLKGADGDGPPQAEGALASPRSARGKVFLDVAGSFPARRDGDDALPDLRDPYAYYRRTARVVAVGSVHLGSGQPVRVVHPFPGRLAAVEHAAARALALAEADGLIERRPDVLSVFIGDAADLAALRAVRTALAGASVELPLAACLPVESPHVAAAAREADLVCLSTGRNSRSQSLAAALDAVAATRRPVQLESLPSVAEPDGVLAAAGAVERVLAAAQLAERAGVPNVLFSVSARDVALALRTYRLLASRLAQMGRQDPLHLLAWPTGDAGEVLLRSAVLLGALLCDGIGDSIQIMGAPRALGDQGRARLAFNVLQGAGVRLSKTEYVACPSCGRTLFNLQETTERIQRQTGHLKGLKIAIMGCIVNGPGEMADADFGYVGGAPDKVNLYVGKECVEKGVPAAVADQRLIELIRARGKWVDPPAILQHQHA